MRYLLLGLFLIFNGCADKVFEPKKVEVKKLKSKDFKELKEYTKHNFTFADFKLKYSKPGIAFDGVEGVEVHYDLNGTYLDKFNKINDNLAVFGNKILVLDENKTYSLPFVIYGATKHKNKIAVVFENGKYGIFDTKTKKMTSILQSDETLSVKYLHANPVFYNNLVLFPLITGNVAVVDLNGNYIRTLAISQNPFNDNVIFLKIVNGRLFMATPSRLILFNPNFLIDYSVDIKHIIAYNGYLYIFTPDGEIIKLDSDLKEIKKVKLPYASFYAPGVCKGNIYTVEKEGYLIKITPNLQVTVYKGNNFDTTTNSMLKIDKCRIYNYNKVFIIE